MARPQPLPRWSRWFVGVVGLCVVALVVWGAWPKRSTATIHSVVVDGARLTVLSDACGTDLRTDIDEGADAVTLTISVQDERNADCSGSEVTVTLGEPLGDRTLVDGSDGVVLRCEPPGAATQECVR